MVFDMRCLKNPYYVDELRDLTGLDGRIERFVLGADGTMDYLGRILDLVRSKLPRFAREGRGTLVLGIGCTGGRHRSVVAARWLADRLREDGKNVVLRHRDIREEAEK